MTGSLTPYEHLTPDAVIDALETAGFESDGRIFPLNSYENRVYQLGVQDGPPLVGKFYRPGRWSDAAILEEHAFTLELVALEIPVVAPLDINGSTLNECHGYRYALFPRQSGRQPELETREDRQWIGRYIGRIHAAGRVRPFKHRPQISIDDLGRQSVVFLLEEGWLPAELEQAYELLCDQLLERIEIRFRDAGDVAAIRLQGDCHLGNVLWNDAGPHFVDFDDCRAGPPIQDLWMLLSGDREEQTVQLGDYVSGYTDFSDLDYRELLLLESLRTLRMIHYAAWLARRWNDPAFPMAFPWFHTARYWQDHLLELKEQLGALDEPPLAV